MEYLHIELTICDSLSNCMFVLSFLESITFLKVAQIVPLDCAALSELLSKVTSPQHRIIHLTIGLPHF